MLALKLFVAAFALFPAAARIHRRSCTSGTYQCNNPANATSTVQVCNAGNWMLSAVCDDGWKCVENSVGGCTCQQ
ncbi:hypothetical protein F4810DRAFT_705148 [Camillea tinctor]|nr:hypothetical protein F4810DRAFT_705148 [Camillea tinctor]